MKHTVKSGFHTNPVKINLIGVGGGGSLVLSGLVRLHLAMKSLGHPYGLDVEVWDPDRVSPANIGRQLFAASEVGLNKAEALVNRCNLGFALNWEAHPECYRFTRIFDVLIACAVWIPESHGKKSFRRSRKRTVHTSLTEAFSPPAGKSSSAMAAGNCRIPMWNCRRSLTQKSRSRICQAVPLPNRFPFRSCS